MAGEFTITVNDNNLRNVMRQLSKKMDDMTPVMETIGDAMLDATKDAFEQERSGFGQPWPKLKRPRRRNKKAAAAGKEGGTKILQDTRALYNSIHTVATANSVIIGSDRVYAAIHQFGGTINRSGRSGKVRLKQSGKQVRFAKASDKKNVYEKEFSHGAYTITIPPRPYLPIKSLTDNSLTPKLKKSIIELMQKFFVEDGK
jgi:phage virion morphogenesis protein